MQTGKEAVFTVADTKKMIVEETEKLLFEKKIKKLTVKDIVDACHITRQAFYYHFSDIPELLKWMLEQKGDELLAECGDSDDIEKQIGYLLLIFVNARPVIKKGIESKYGEELEKLLMQNVQNLFQRLAEKQGAFQKCTPFEQGFIIRYHCQAVMGIVQHWSEEDTKNLNQIAHAIFLTLSEGVSS